MVICPPNFERVAGRLRTPLDIGDVLRRDGADSGMGEAPVPFLEADHYPVSPTARLECPPVAFQDVRKILKKPVDRFAFV
jgi:hypothetical protein